MKPKPLTLDESDLGLLADFRLRWRWLEANQHPLPQEELARIRPLTRAAAQRAWELSLQLHSHAAFDARPSAEVFGSIERLEAAHENDGDSWLGRRLPASPVPIIVSWQPEDAVLTDSELFARRWEAFCYPASDDVSIWPVDLAWVVTYWHEEQLWFGTAGERQRPER